VGRSRRQEEKSGESDSAVVRGGGAQERGHLERWISVQLRQTADRDADGVRLTLVREMETHLVEHQS